MKIIGHRGAADLAPENTIKSIKRGIAEGVDAVEFDVRQTKDGVFVLLHDEDLLRIAGANTKIADISVASAKAIDPFSGEPIPTLDEALEARGKTMAVVEAKGGDWAKQLVAALKKHMPSLHVCVIAFNHQELALFHELLKDVPCYALEERRPFKAIRFAKKAGFSGIDLHYKLINPFTYLYARLHRLDVICYTVNRPSVMRYLRRFYPRVAITTNRPDLLKKIIED